MKSIGAVLGAIAHVRYGVTEAKVSMATGMVCCSHGTVSHIVRARTAEFKSKDGHRTPEAQSLTHWNEKGNKGGEHAPALRTVGSIRK
jgi:hypothetical protein